MSEKPDLLLAGEVPDWDRAPLAEDFTLHAVPSIADLAELSEEVRTRLKAVAVMGHTPFGAERMALLPSLALIANYGVGYDAIDIAAARERGIAVTNTPDVLTDDVADLAVGMWLARARDIVGAEAWVRSNSWQREGAYPLQHRASSRKAGILGLGRIGRAIAARMAAFGMDIAYFSRGPKDAPAAWRFEADPVALADWADVLVVAVAGGPATVGIVSAEVIGALGPADMLVNISRGSTVDEEALIAALSTGRLGQAALDVFASEPDLDARFLALPNVLLQPHQASGTVETRKAMGQLMRDNITAFFAGRPLLTPV
ncbi:MAG: 2-hydroxyacid dehydrogenase [Pseudomonadota bacterium]